MPENSERRIGVFVCHCGGNISDYVDVHKVAEACAGEPGVMVSHTHMFTCSDAAQQDMIAEIQEYELDGLVIASCSPKLHMYTFRGMAERGGINAYQYVHVNLREQCSWAHRAEMPEATQKGIELVRAGIAKCRLMEPLRPIRVETKPRALVVGAGVAGLRAALALSDLGLGVFIIEKEPAAGGWSGQWKSMCPDNANGAAIVEGLLEKVKAREDITLFTGAELVEKSGSVGDFDVRLQMADGNSVSANVGAIVVATGFDVYEPRSGEFGYGMEGVVTLPEFKKSLEASAGQLTHNGKPVNSIAYVYCVGSRQSKSECCPEPNKYCSRYCCSAGVHTAVNAQTAMPGLHQFHLFRDMRTYGKDELLYEQARDSGSVFVRYSPENAPVVEQADGGLLVRVADELTGGEELEIPVDLVVLLTGMVPRDNASLVDVLKLPLSQDGFFNELHLKLRPVETVVDGVFVAGSCQSPKTMAESVAGSLAAVSKAGALLMKGHVDLEPMIATIDPERCTGCETCDVCTQACPYDAVARIHVGDREVATIIDALCKGEGACVPVCPAGAIDIKGYRNGQILSMIEAFARETV